MRRKHGLTLVELLVVLGIICVLAAILVPNFIRARSRAPLTSCKSNLKNAATALSMYATDNEKRYPLELSLLTPNYLKIIPNCPSAWRDTYSESYRSRFDPDAFTLFCQGTNHRSANTPENYPQYSSYQGLIER